jgi:hypothetical protein
MFAPGKYQNSMDLGQHDPKVVFSPETEYKAKINQNDILHPKATPAGQK